MARRSSTFYKIERKLDDSVAEAYEFHTVVNGNTYYNIVEEWICENDTRKWKTDVRHGVKVSKDSGNKLYKHLIQDCGYRFVGKFEMDIYGHKEPLV